MNRSLLVQCLLAAVAIAGQDTDNAIAPETTQPPQHPNLAVMVEPRQYFGHDLIGYEPYSNSCKKISNCSRVAH